MTEQEAIEKMESLPDDSEMAHGMAEDILTEFLHENGYSALAEAFDAANANIGFWYA